MPSDYHHYAYQCPYLTGAEEMCIRCEGGSIVRFTAVADCRRFLLKWCAHPDQTWRDCCIAQARTDRIERNIKTKREIKAWVEMQKKKKK